MIRMFAGPVKPKFRFSRDRAVRQRPCSEGSLHGFPHPCEIRRHRRRHSRLELGLAPGREPAQERQRQRQGHPGARQDGHRGRRLRHRLRRHPEQLLPAGHAPADAAQRLRVGQRSPGLQLPPGRLHADQPGADARGRRLDLRAAEGDRLRVGLHRGRGRLHEVHEGDVRRLASQGHHLGPAREEGRLRQQPRLDLRPRQEGGERGRAHHDRRQGHRLQARQQRRGEDRRDRPGQHRLRLCHRRRRPLGEAHLGHAGAAEGHPHQGPRRQGARQRADVGLLEPAGGHARRRSRSCSAPTTARCRR